MAGRSADRYPVAATATAHAYDLAEQAEPVAPVRAERAAATQTSFFPNAEVIPFDALTSPAERQSIRERAAQLEQSGAAAVQRPQKVERTSQRAATRRSRLHPGQQELGFIGAAEVASATPSQIICDAPVAPVALRAQAAAIDLAVVVLGAVVCGTVIRLTAGPMQWDKHLLAVGAVCLVALALVYRLLWCAVDLDSLGLQMTRLKLVDFDGHTPSRALRLQRIFAGLLSVGAAGVGLVWAFVDQDGLSWHDHISTTFPTVPGEN